jgi:hypothetical protein
LSDGKLLSQGESHGVAFILDILDHIVIEETKIVVASQQIIWLIIDRAIATVVSAFLCPLQLANCHTDDSIGQATKNKIS